MLALVCNVAVSHAGVSLPGNTPCCKSAKKSLYPNKDVTKTLKTLPAYPVGVNEPKKCNTMA